MDNKPLLGPEDEEMVNTYDMIKSHEGFRADPYLDHNKHETIGHGIKTDSKYYQDFLKENQGRFPGIEFKKQFGL